MPGGTDQDLLYKLLVKDEGRRVLKQHQATLKKLTAEEKKALKVSEKQRKAALAETKAIDKRRKAREKSIKTLKAAGKAAVVGLAIAGTAALAFGAKAVQMASNVEEAAAKFDEVFGPAAKRTGDAIDEFAEKAQRSRFALREMAADVGAVLEPMLGSKDAASDMAVQLTKLTTDLSSFNNVAESDVLVALRSGMIGNMEPMLQFGVVLRQSKVNAEVLASGMADTKDEITEAMRVTARFNIIMRETQTAQGDAERTGESFANQMRGLEAAVEELVIGIGQELLPVAKQFITVLNQILGSSRRANDEIIEATRSTDAFTRAMAAHEVRTQGANRVISAFSENQKRMQEAVRRGEMTIEEYNKAIQETAQAARDGSDQLVGMSAGLGGMNRELAKRENIDALNDSIQLLDERSLLAIGATHTLTEAFGEEVINAGLVGDELLEMAAAHGDVEAAATLEAKAIAVAELAMEEAIPTAAELKVKEDELKASQEAAAESAKRRAESLESMRKAAADAAIAHGDLAASLSDATKQEFASAAISQLKDKLNDGVINAEQFEVASRNLMITNGLATEQSFAQADALETVVGLYAANKISAEELTTATGLLKDAGVDGEISMSDLGLSVQNVTEDTERAKKETMLYAAEQGEWSDAVDAAKEKGDRMIETLNAIEEDTRANMLETEEYKDELKQVVTQLSELTSREWIVTTRFDTTGEPPTPSTDAQHGFHGTVTGPHMFRIEPGVTERVDISPTSGGTTTNRNTSNTFNQTINTTQPVDLGRRSNINRNRAGSF